MTRRSLLRTAMAAPAAGRASSSALLLGYDTYSVRAWRWKSAQHFDYAERQKLDAIQFSGIGDFESTEPAFLHQVKERAQRLNLVLDGGTGCVCPTSAAWGKRTDDPAAYLAAAIDVAHRIGARCVRVFVGTNADRFRPDPMDRHIESTVKVLRACRNRALDANLRIAVENHGDFQARDLLTLIDQAGRDYVGACLDTGNPLHVLENPVSTLELLGPVTVTTHYRDSAVFEHPRGAAVQWTAMGEGSVDWRSVLELHAKLCPLAPVHLEIITGRPPVVIPFYEQEFWKAYPKANAADFARYLALVKSGRPFSGSMIIADVPGERPPEFAAALKLQQRRDLDRSLDFMRQQLGTGRQWRSAQ